MVDSSTVNVEFMPGELRIVGGDYGQITLEGTHEAASRELDKVVAAARRGGRRIDLTLVVDYDDGEADFIESRHAGLEGTTRDERAGTIAARSEDAKAPTENGAGPGEGGSHP